MYIRILLIIAVFSFHQAIAQTYNNQNYSFEDSNSFPGNRWLGDTAKFFVNAYHQLQLIDSSNNSPAIIGFQSSIVDSAVWEFYFKADFSPSSSNYSTFYLFSNQLEFQQKGEGYFVRIGGQSGNTDRVSLYRQDGNTSAEIIAGRAGIVGTSSVAIKIKVSRSFSSNWQLYSDTTSSLNQFILEGQVVDSTYKQAKFTAWYCKYTSTRSDKFFLDDISISGYPLIDRSFPEIDSFTVHNDSSASLYFSEAMQNTGELYLSAIQEKQRTSWTSNRSLDLIFSPKLADGQSYHLLLKNFADSTSNPLKDTIYTFQYYEEKMANYRELVINELMIDYSPAVGLPEVEYIELFNASSRHFNLENWTIEDLGTLTSLPNIILGPGDFVILSEPGFCTQFIQPKACIELNAFPSLNNDADQLILKDYAGNIIDQLFYEKTWYQDPNKDEGGYALEQINPYAPCVTSENYAASQSSLGGSPGLINSIFNSSPDSIPPQLQSLELLANNKVLLRWNEAIDSIFISFDSVFELEERKVTSLRLNADSKELLCTFYPAIDSGIVYSIGIKGIKDCWGNSIPFQEHSLLLAIETKGNALVLNEVLFNPYPYAHDFIELYNNSDEWINLKDWSIARYTDSIIQQKKICEEHYYLAPRAFLLVSEMPEELLAIYPFSKRESFYQMKSLPTLPDDEGVVVLIDHKGKERDRFLYREDLHFELIKNKEGVSLERVDPNKNAAAENLFSASKKDNYASPGYQNSQYYPDSKNKGKLYLESESFSPDNDGYFDRLIIAYEMEKPGYLLNLKIFNASGIEQIHLLNNELLSNSGRIYWDGLDVNKQKCKIGIYILFFQFYHPDGSSFELKKTAILAATLR